MLLAAGFGTRLRPLTNDLPKPLLPLWNTTLLDRAFAHIRRWGVREALVNLHHGADRILDHVRAHPPPGLRIAFSFEPEILGTGGALRRARWFFDDQPFWIVNTDLALDVAAAPFRRALGGRPAPLAALWVTTRAGPRTVSVARGRVTDFHAPNPGGPGTATFCGVHVVHPRLLTYLPDAPCCSVIEAYTRALRAGETIAALSPRGARWADLGTPAQYLAAHAAFAPDAPAADFVCAAPDARIAPSATATRSVILAGARIGPRARLTSAVIGRGVALDTACAGIAVQLAQADDPGAAAAAARALDWPADATALMPLSARGSGRIFERLAWRRRTAILIRHTDAARAENRRYAGHARLLRAHGVAVPRVLAELSARDALVLEDLGDASLEAAVHSRAPAERPAFYRRALRPIAALHAITPAMVARAGVTLEPPFDAALYTWEHDLFETHFLAARVTAARDRRAIRAELATVARALLAQPRVLVHRDLQSSNILLPGGRPHLIDFQGMRWGPAAYDLASLLCDPYVMLDPDTQAALRSAYARLTGRPVAADVFWLGAVQRLAQALGAFGRLGAQPATRRFLAHIPPALAMLRRATTVLGGLPRLRAISGLTDR